MKIAIINAFEKGMKMKSELPLAMHTILNDTSLEYVVDSLNQLNVDKIISVLDKENKIIENKLVDKCEVVLKDTAIFNSLNEINNKFLFIKGNLPLISKESLALVYENLNNCDVVLVEKNLKTYDGLICFNNKVFSENIDFINKHNDDLLDIIMSKNYNVKVLKIKDEYELSQVNDRFDIYKLSKHIQKNINEYHMLNGVSILDIENTYIGKNVLIESDCIIYPNVYLFGNTKIGKNTKILPQSFIENGEIGENTIIDSSHIINSVVKNNCTVGPYSHLRMNTVVENDVRIGNFVEFKNTKFDDLSRCAHLTYLGDSEVGKDVNIGCGVVTVNYDGKKKYKTIVKDGAFIGSNSNLIAPIVIEKDAVVAAGSTIYEDVDSGDMAIARSRQENKLGYGTRFKNK